MDRDWVAGATSANIDNTRAFRTRCDCSVSPYRPAFLCALTKTPWPSLPSTLAIDCASAAGRRGATDSFVVVSLRVADKEEGGSSLAIPICIRRSRSARCGWRPTNELLKRASAFNPGGIILKGAAHHDCTGTIYVYSHREKIWSLWI